MSINQISTKVCIIGASLAGLLTANILQKNHIPCIVVEKNSYLEMYARSRVGLVDNKTVNILQEYGLSDRLLQEGIPQGKCEFRTPEQNFVLDYAKICQGQVRYTYPQQELLMDSIEKFQQAQGTILFDTEAVTISNSDRGAKVQCQQNEATVIIDSDFIAGCDGFGGISRNYIPDATKALRKNFNYAWLAIDVEADYLRDQIIYASHPNGFAGHLPHSRNVSRCYLQISLKDTVANWSNRRILSELQLRLAKNDSTSTEGKIIAKQIVKMEHFTSQTMQHCRLFLAGNSAHITTPAAEKEMNLAIQDAEVLGKSFVSYYCYQDNLPLKNYSQNRVPKIAEMQQFSESLLHTVEIQDDRTLFGKSQQRVRQFKLSQLMNSEIYASNFARKYVGYVKGDRSQTKLPTSKKSANVVNFNLDKLPPLKVG